MSEAHAAPHAEGRDDAPVNDADEACLLCGDEPVVAVAFVASAPGDVLAFPSDLSLCVTCRDLLQSCEDGMLAKRLTPEFEEWGRDIAIQTLRKNLVAVS